MDVPSFKEIRAFLTLHLIPKRLYPPPQTWSSIRKFRKYAANFVVEDDGRLCLLNDDKKVKVVEDVAEAISIFTAAHEVQHDDCEKTFQTVQKTFYWHGMQDDIKLWIKHCKLCSMKQKKLKEDAQSVLLDHAYLSWYSMAQLRGDGQAKIKYSAPAPNASKDTTSPDLRPKKINGNSQVPSQVRIALPVNTACWDHDYIADELTLRRRLHVFLHDDKITVKDQEFNFAKPVVSEAGIENVAAKETYIKTVPFHVKSDLNLIPNADEASFLVLLGLEALANTSRELESLDEEDVYKEDSFYFPPALSCAACDQCGTDFSPLWHKKVDDSVVCAACHVKSKCKENEGKAQASYNEYLGRYKLVLAGMKENAILKSKDVVGRHDIQKKRQEALSQFTRMRKIAMFKANLVTNKLLNQKGIKTSNLSSQDVFTKKIRLKVPTNRLKPHIQRKVSEALENKRAFQKFLHSKLAEHKKGTQPTSSQSTAKIGFKSSTVATDHSAALGHPNITSGTSSQLNYLHKVQHLASNAAKNSVKRLRVAQQLDSQQRRFLLQMQARKVKLQEIQRLRLQEMQRLRDSLKQQYCMLASENNSSPKGPISTTYIGNKTNQPVKLRDLSKK